MMSITAARPAVVLATVALFGAGLVGVTVSTAAAEEPGWERDIQAKTMAIVLTPEQARQLRTQWVAGRDLSPQQALDVLGVKRAELVPAPTSNRASSADEGEAEQSLDCSHMYLWGDSDGHWLWSNEFFPRSTGPAAFGRGAVETNDAFSTSDTFNISGLEQRETGQLYSVGLFPTGTVVEAWSVNFNASGSPRFCYGTLTAYYGYGGDED